MKAYCLIREQPFYRRDVFVAGLQRAGFEVFAEMPARIERGDVLVIWNRYWSWHEKANLFERAGGTVLVAENGYLGTGGSTPKFDVHPRGPKPTDYYALAIGGHNGSGDWKPGDDSRWKALNVPLKSWRKNGDHILVCPSRTFGRPDMTMPGDWVQRTTEELKRHTRRPIRLRVHPGNDQPQRSVKEDLANAWACVIWASSAGVHALVEGIPVFYGAPHWICDKAAQRDLADIESPWCNDTNRLVGFREMSWAQWTLEEIGGGGPFRRLLGIK